MNLVLEREAPPFNEDESGAIRIGNTRVLLELVIRAFQDGASPETIVQRYSTLSLSDAYTTIGYYLRHQQEIESYLSQREQLAESVRQKLSNSQPALTLIRSRLLAQQTLYGGDKAKTHSNASAFGCIRQDPQECKVGSITL
jgi:uncharacterized protein (DUF433 family)